MRKRKTQRRLAVFGLLVVALVAASLLLHVFQTQNQVTGNIVAQGGNITQLNIAQSIPLAYWSLVYGQITASGITQESIGSAQVLFRNISGSSPTSATAIIAHFDNSFDEADISQINPVTADALLGISPAHLQSLSNTFNETTNFTIGNTTYLLNSTRTQSFSGNYSTGVFLSNGSVSFVTQWVNGRGFDNTTIEYQLLIPLNVSRTVHFDTVTFSNATGSCSANATADAWIANDNSSVVIDWPTIAGATGYELYFTDGKNATNYIDFNETNKWMGIINSNYTDTNASSERYYQVRVLFGGSDCLINNTVAHFAVNLTANDANMVTFPLQFRNNSVEEVLRSVYTSISSVNEYDNTLQTYNFYIRFGGFVFSNFDTIKLGRGYWFTVDDNVTLRMAGQTVYNFSEALYNTSNLIGFPIIEGNNSVAYSLRSVDGNYSSLNEYDNAIKAYNFYILFSGFVFSNFDTIKPTYGYWITANATDTLTLP